MSKSRYQFKNDKYRKARGGFVRFLTVYCAKCKTRVLFYQKDGPGPLKRLYLDRIVSPTKITKLASKFSKRIPWLKCVHCKRILGVPLIYKKENRPAYCLLQDATKKKIIAKDKLVS